MSKVTDEEAMVVGLLARKADAGTAGAAGRDLRAAVSPQDNGTAVGDVDEAAGFGVGARLEVDVAVAGRGTIVKVEAGKETLSGERADEIVRHLGRRIKIIRIQKRN